MDEQLYLKLKKITDFYIQVLHNLMGYYIDSTQGFSAYLKSFKKQQVDSGLRVGLAISELDKAQLIYSTGAPDDPKALMLHECTQGELKHRLQKDGFNLVLTGQFCLINMYEYWEGIVRREIAKVLGIEPNELKSDIFGDIRHLRHDITHNHGLASKNYTCKNKIITNYRNNNPINITEATLHKIVAEIFDYFNSLVETKTGKKPYTDYSLSQTSKQRQMEHIEAGNMKVIDDTLLK